MSETFDLNAFIDGSSYPTKTVTVYTNVAAMKRAQDIAEEITNKGGLDRKEQLENELVGVRKTIEESGLNFEFQGMPFTLARSIADIFAEEDSENAPSEDDVLELVQKSIASVTNAAGAKSSVPDVAGLKHLQSRLSPIEFNKLINGAVEVSFTAANYEASIDAGFPGGGADVE